MNFGQFLTILRARRALILMVVLIVVASVVGATMLMPLRYQATASVVIDPKSATMAAGTAYLTGRADDVMSTQLDIIASPAVAIKVVEALGLERRRDIAELVADANPLSRAWRSVSRLFADDEASAPPDLKEWIAGHLLRNLQVRSNRDSRLMRITYSAPEGGFAAAAANGFIKAYLETVLQLQVGPAKQNAELFDQQSTGLRRKLEQAEAKLSAFQQEKGIVATDERMDFETGRLSELSGQLAMAQSQSYESHARQRQLRDYLGGGKGAAPTEVMTSPVVQQLRQNIAEREAKLGELSKRMGPNHPQHQSASTELAQLRTQLNDEMRAAAQGALTSSGVAPQREGSLRGALEQQRSRVLKLKNDRNTLAMLMREVDGARQAYDAATQRFTQARIAGDAGQASGAVVDSAAPPTRPAGPKMWLNAAIALAAGVALGVGIALLCETVNGFVRSERDIVEILGEPVLAVLAPKGSKRTVQYIAGPTIYSLPRP
ncbi:MAG: hypothetical protein HY322_06535 [Betaproteobacteria bacterium]|nr:hypothetical protein [Betaproteobacteria bacterium]